MTASDRLRVGARSIVMDQSDPSEERRVNRPYRPTIHNSCLAVNKVGMVRMLAAESEIQVCRQYATENIEIHFILESICNCVV